MAASIRLAALLSVALLSSSERNPKSTNPAPVTDSIASVAKRFHTAQTTAERALKGALVADDRGLGVLDYVQRPTGSAIDDRYRRYFSSALLQAWDRAQKRLLDENCKGKDDEYGCGMTVDPFTCAQDNPGGRYVFRTVPSQADQVVVEMTWAWLKDAVGTYRMKRNGGRWVVDAVRCGGARKGYNWGGLD